MLWIWIVALCLMQQSVWGASPDQLRVEIMFPPEISRDSLTGRLFVMITRTPDPEARLQYKSLNPPPIFGLDVNELRPNQTVVMAESVPGYPVRTLRDLPAGDYYVQALLNVYTQFHRADSHVIWAHMDQWEGQQFNLSPGNLYSKSERIHLDPLRSNTVKLRLTEIIPPVQIPPDTEWVRHVKIKSELLSRFWGHPMYLGAVVLLPRDYDAYAQNRYPVIYLQGHFDLGAPFEFATQPTAESEGQRQYREGLGVETGYEFYKAWSSRKFPRVIVVTLQHPTPYYDNSFAVDSVNSGPYGEAITTELIPYIEKHFRTIARPYGRVLTGGSAGGFEALALQLYHPNMFGGAWIFCPAEIDFRRYYSINLYGDQNAFIFQRTDVAGPQFSEEWLPTERILARTNEGQPIVTVRQVRQLESVLGSHGRGDIWFDPSEATYGPVGPDGYPVHIFDPNTGQIDREVANWWRSHEHDLRDYAQRNWPRIGPQLTGKLHFYVGDMDEFYINLDVYLFEDFLKGTVNPSYDGSFVYGRPSKGHMWSPMTHTDLMRVIADYIARHAPSGASMAWRE